MTRLLARLFRLEPGELGRVFVFMLLAALLQAGLATGTSAADSLFLVHIGADHLPIIYVATPLMMLLYIPAYSYLLGRFGIDRVFDLTLGLLVVGGVGFFFALTARADGTISPVFYYAVKLYAALWYIGIYTLFWNFIDGYFHLTDAKRLFGLLAGGSALGAIVGGALVNRLSAHLEVRAFFLGWAGFALLAWPVVRWIRARHHRLETGADEADEVPPPLRETLRHITASRFVLVLVLVLFLTLLTATVCEYQYLNIFSEAADEKTLAALFGELFALVNAFNLLVSLFIFNPLVRRLGVRNVALIQPVTYLAVFGLLLIHHGFGAAMLGFLAFQGIMTSIDFNNVNLLFAGLPENGKKQLRTFIEGICEPLATATAGVFLFFVAPRMSPENLSTIGFVCALACLLLVLMLRVDYVQVMITHVRRGGLDFTAAREEVPVAADEADVARLERHAASPDAAVRITALRALWRSAPPRATDPLFSYLAQADAAGRQAVQPLVAAMLASQDGEFLRCGLEWSARHAETLDPLLFEEFSRHGLVPVEAGAQRLTAPGAADRAAAVSLLWQSGRLAESRVALDTVEQLLRAGGEDRLAGIHGLGRMGETRFIPLLAPHLASDEPAVRHETLVALRHLANREAVRLVPPLLRLLAAGGPPAERELAFEIFGRIADSSALDALLRQALRFTPHERRLVEQMVAAIGPRAVPTLVTTLQDFGTPLFARSIAARALARLAPAQLQAITPGLIDTIVRRCFEFAGYAVALQAVTPGGPGVAMLAFVYRDLSRLTLEVALELLSVTGRLPAYDSILAALRTGDPRDRSYALENIESACSRKLFTVLRPFIEEQPLAAILAVGRAAGFACDVTAIQAIERSLGIRFALESSAALQALRETEPARWSDVARAKLRGNPTALVRETALALLARDLPDAPATLTPAERALLLTSSDLFKDWGVRQLEMVNPHLRVVVLGAGTAPLFAAGARADGIYVIVNGTVTLEGTGPAAARTHRAGAVVGVEALLGATTRPHGAEASDLVALYLPTHAIHACAAAHGTVALDLLRRKLAAA